MQYVNPINVFLYVTEMQFFWFIFPQYPAVFQLVLRNDHLNKTGYNLKTN